MKTPGPGHLPVSALLHALVITGKRHVTRLFGFKLSQTALFVQTAFYLLGFYVVILNHKRYFIFTSEKTLLLCQFWALSICPQDPSQRICTFPGSLSGPC